MSGSIKRVFIGLNAVGERAVGSYETKASIWHVKKFECALVNPDGDPATWDMFDDPKEPRTIFQFVLRDRIQRIDNRRLMADRPPFAVITIHGNRAVRLEFYEGHDALELSHDLRAPELKGVKLPLFLEKDPQAYDPMEYLKSIGAVPEGTEEIVREILKEAHEKKPES